MNPQQTLVKIDAAIFLSIFLNLASWQPAGAELVNTFSFTNIHGNIGGTVTGKITFDNLNPGDNATDVAADSVIVESISPSLPEWEGVGGMELNKNLLDLDDVSIKGNVWNIVKGVITGGFLEAQVVVEKEENTIRETVTVGQDVEDFLEKGEGFWGSSLSIDLGRNGGRFNWQFYDIHDAPSGTLIFLESSEEHK
ncbi:exported hypothetical protein [Hyella patelloides LEGE 07179]|uniref:Uncharacterized protein n=2 Tax=Hyella TaxID=945733 RepID=A0A563VJS0_9CYAN|nr:exported hypothetical protein [Hyella patelloides LEGE 07179]